MRFYHMLDKFSIYVGVDLLLPRFSGIVLAMTLRHCNSFFNSAPDLRGFTCLIIWMIVSSVHINGGILGFSFSFY